MIDISILRSAALFVAIACFLLTCFFAYSRLSFLNGSRVTQGKAIKVVSTQSTLGLAKNHQDDLSNKEIDQSTQSMLVRFTAEDGQVVDVELPISPNMEVGKPVQLIYTPSEPSGALENFFLQIWIKTILFGVITCVLFFVYFFLK